jgi:hypothetical protein
MALREFDGPGGHRWKAWDVTSAQIHPKTRAEDYMRDLADGWIVFERVDGEEKRRLSPYPAGWQSCSDEEVAALCASAEIVTRRLTPPLGAWKIGDAPVGPASPPAPGKPRPRGIGSERRGDHGSDGHPGRR